MSAASSAPSVSALDAAPAATVRPPRVDAAALQRHLRRSAGLEAPWLHQEVARRMAERLQVVRSQPAAVLDWWSHAGAGAELLRQAYPKARLTAVEPAAALPSDQRAPRWWQRLLGQAGTSVCSDAALPAELAPAQLLWANMMLHWIDDLPTLLQRWHAAIAADGFLMFSCFGPDTLRELQGLHQALGWGPSHSAWIDMHDLGDELVHAGFADPVMDMELLTLTWDSPARLLEELRGLGCNTAPARHTGLRGRRWRAALEAELSERLRGPDGRLHLSFEIVYGHAFRPAPRPRVQAQTAISLQDMREMTRRRSSN
ncbi:MAG: hypothetical protein RJA44_987 [Pseudomonadota bacterium]|jgi:malonyl-CoA O-methyltransferase